MSELENQPMEENTPENNEMNSDTPNQPEAATHHSTEENHEVTPLPESPEQPAEAPVAETVDPRWKKIADSADAIKAEIGKIVVGQEGLLDALLVGLLAGGHTLIEGVPGIAKTLTAKMMAKSLELDFSRVQFTPDLMPSDVVGTNIFNVSNSKFEFVEGPVFSQVVLIDEINRAPAKTQSALFELMEEYQVSIDGVTYPMAKPFFVLATQNPLEQEGTYRLPEAQMDRFLFRIVLDYPNYDSEVEILHRFKSDFTQTVSQEVKSILKGEDIIKMQKDIMEVAIEASLVAFIAQIVTKTRNHPDLFLGASPRASLAILKASKAHAALRGRGFVTPDDIVAMALPALNHRVVLSPEKEMEGYSPNEVLQAIIDTVDIPR
jgi:MoxR-like ATPase